MYLFISTEQNTHFSVGLGDKSGLLEIKVVKKPFQQSELLLSEINNIIGRKKIDGIIVVKGPGAFSALRIGVATANALAYGWHIPVVGVKVGENYNNINVMINFLYEEGLVKIKKVKKNKFVVPEYGREPNITN